MSRITAPSSEWNTEHMLYKDAGYSTICLHTDTSLQHSIYHVCYEN